MFSTRVDQVAPRSFRHEERCTFRNSGARSHIVPVGEDGDRSVADGAAAQLGDLGDDGSRYGIAGDAQGLGEEHRGIFAVGRIGDFDPLPRGAADVGVEVIGEVVHRETLLRGAPPRGVQPGGGGGHVDRLGAAAAESLGAAGFQEPGGIGERRIEERFDVRVENIVGLLGERLLSGCERPDVDERSANLYGPGGQRRFRGTAVLFLAGAEKESGEKK